MKSKNNKNEYGSIRKSFLKLPKQYRTILYLYYWKNMSPKKISNELFFEVSTVHRLHSEGVEKLRRLFCEELRK